MRTESDRRYDPCDIRDINERHYHIEDCLYGVCLLFDKFAFEVQSGGRGSGLTTEEIPKSHARTENDHTGNFPSLVSSFTLLHTPSIH